MKIIFLDVDGILNWGVCKSRAPSGCLGVEDDKVELLKQIVDRTGAKIVLTSTWKSEWFRTDFIEDLPRDGAYLQKRLKRHGLTIMQKNRG